MGSESAEEFSRDARYEKAARFLEEMCELFPGRGREYLDEVLSILSPDKSSTSAFDNPAPNVEIEKISQKANERPHSP